MAPPAALRSVPLSQPAQRPAKDEFGDDIAYAVIPARPPFNPAEAEGDGSDWVSLAKAVLFGVIAICIIGWLLRH